MADAGQATDLPGGTVTFLLTGVEGSTKLWEAHPPAMVQALADHDRMVVATVAGHGGVLVKQKGEGDRRAPSGRRADALTSAQFAECGCCGRRYSHFATTTRTVGALIMEYQLWRPGLSGVDRVE